MIRARLAILSTAAVLESLENALEVDMLIFGPTPATRFVVRWKISGENFARFNERLNQGPTTSGPPPRECHDPISDDVDRGGSGGVSPEPDGDNPDGSGHCGGIKRRCPSVRGGRQTDSAMPHGPDGGRCPLPGAAALGIRNMFAGHGGRIEGGARVVHGHPGWPRRGLRFLPRAGLDATGAGRSCGQPGPGRHGVDERDQTGHGGHGRRHV
jgi:hypothetical protein